MKKLGLLGVAVAALLLAGCSAVAGEPAGSVPSDASKPSHGATPEAANAPQIGESSPPQFTAEPESNESRFLVAAQRIEGLQGATLDELMPVGLAMCKALDSGAVPTELTPIANAGVQENYDFVFVSADLLCNEHSERVNVAITEASIANRPPVGIG